jgi:hypothetical protein
MEFPWLEPFGNEPDLALTPVRRVSKGRGILTVHKQNIGTLIPDCYELFKNRNILCVFCFNLNRLYIFTQL